MDKVRKADLGQEEARGFRGKSPLIDSDKGDESINAAEPAGKGQAPTGHAGSDASSFAEHRIGDLPLFDEESAESAMQDGNKEDEQPGEANPTATKEQLVMAVARALGLGQRVRKSADDDLRAEVREVHKAVEYLIQKLDPVGARAAGIMGSVEKEDRGPVYRNDQTDDKSRLVIKELITELQKANPRMFGTEGGDMGAVRKSLREEGLPILSMLAGQLWAGQMR